MGLCANGLEPTCAYFFITTTRASTEASIITAVIHFHTLFTSSYKHIIHT